MKFLRHTHTNHSFGRSGEIPIFEVISAILRLTVQPAITVSTKAETYELHRIKPESWTGQHFALILTGRETEHVIHVDDIQYIIAPLEVVDERAEARRARLAEVSRVRADSPGDVRAHLMASPDEELAVEAVKVAESEIRPKVQVEKPKDKYGFYFSVRRDRGEYDRKLTYEVNDSFRWCDKVVIVWRRIGPYLDIILPDNTVKRLKGL